MAGSSVQSRAAWRLADRQDGVVRWDQLIALGLSRHAIAHRVECGRLHPLWPKVYAVGRRTVNRRGLWRAAMYASGRGAALSHGTAIAFWKLLPEGEGVIHVTVPRSRCVRLKGIRCHRRSNAGPGEVVEIDGIRVTTPATTLIDVAAGLGPAELERAINEADKLDLISPDGLREAIDRCPRRPGLGVLRRLLDRRTFALTDSELERRFIPLARRAGLGPPLTGVVVNGFKVDFYWPELGLVVETDGLRYHRTPAQQTRDRLRDQAHAAAGLTPLRFTHAQVHYEPVRTAATLRAVAERLMARSNRV